MLQHKSNLMTSCKGSQSQNVCGTTLKVNQSIPMKMMTCISHTMSQLYPPDEPCQYYHAYMGSPS